MNMFYLLMKYQLAKHIHSIVRDTIHNLCYMVKKLIHNHFIFQANFLHSSSMAKYVVPEGYKCSICGHVARAESSFRYHMMRHRGRFPTYCPYCDQGAFSSGQLMTHLTNQHTGKVGWHCIRCGRDLLKINYLRDHLKTCQGAGQRP